VCGPVTIQRAVDLPVILRVQNHVMVRAMILPVLIRVLILVILPVISLHAGLVVDLRAGKHAGKHALSPVMILRAEIPARILVRIRAQPPVMILHAEVSEIHTAHLRIMCRFDISFSFFVNIQPVYMWV